MSLFLLVILSTAVSAQELVRHEFVSSRPDTELEDLLYFSTALYMSDLGYSSTRDDSPGVDYLFVTSYELDGDAVSLEYVLAEPGSANTPILSQQAMLRLDFTVDQQIQAALERFSSRLVLEDSAEETVSGSILGVIPTEDEKHNLGLDNGFYLESKLPLYFFMGDIASLFRVGGGLSLQGGYRFGRWGIPSRVGINLDWLLPVKREGVVGGQLMFFAAGPEFGVFTGYGRGLLIAAAFTPGYGLLVLSGDEQTRFKSVPSLKISGAAAINLSRSTVLGIDAAYSAIFDPHVRIDALQLAISIHLDR